MPAKPVLGLYFTDSFIEIAQVSSDSSRLILYGNIPLPSGIVVNGEVKSVVDFKKKLQELLNSTKPRAINFGEKVVIGVGDNRVFLREFTLPKYVGREIEDAIDYQVRSLLPLLPSGVETDWQIIGHDAEGQIEVLLAAIPNSIIQSYMSIVSEVGLQVVAIEPAVFANIRIIKPAQLKQKNQLLVYLGDDYAEFTYMTNGNPRFSDFLPSSEITKKGGIANAVRDYVIFSNSKHPNRPITEIIISGFSDQVEALVSTYRSQRVAAYLADSRLSSSVVKDHGLLHTSHGLSLKPTSTTNSFNLLPISFRLEMLKERLFGRWKFVLDVLIILTLVVTGGMFYLYRIMVTKQAQIQSLGDIYKKQILEPRNQDLSESAKNLNLLSDQLIYLRGATGGEGGILKELSAITPEGISLTSLLYSRGSSSARLADPNATWALTGTANSRQLVLDFYNKLIAQSDFSNGKLYFGSLEKESSISFRIASQTK